MGTCDKYPPHQYVLHPLPVKVLQHTQKACMCMKIKCMMQVYLYRDVPKNN